MSVDSPFCQFSCQAVISLSHSISVEDMVTFSAFLTQVFVNFAKQQMEDEEIPLHPRAAGASREARVSPALPQQA